MNPQLDKLDALIRAAITASEQARRGRLLASMEGLAVAHAWNAITDGASGDEVVNAIEARCEPELSGATVVSRTINDMNWSRSAS